MSGGLQNRDMAGRLAGATPELVRDLRRRYRDAAQQAAGKSKRRILGAASSHPGGLRAEIAGTVTVTVRTRSDGIVAEIASRGIRMPPGKKNLPAYADNFPPYTRWRHPVFGRSSDPWVLQEWVSAQGWFTRAIQGERDNFAAAAERALDNLAAKLGRR